MTQITTGIRSLLSKPIIYRLFQVLAGGGVNSRRRFFEQHIVIEPGSTVLDIGCGPADILDYLPPVKYYGFDISDVYIKTAQEKYKEYGNFFFKELTKDDLGSLPTFDYVLCIGLLHHLTDDEVRNTIALSKLALKPGGKLITLDGCFAPGQNPLAKLILSLDRGQHVRTKKGYDDLIKPYFDAYESATIHRSWIPYTHCITKSSN